MLLQSDFDNTMANLQSSIAALKGKREEQERNRWKQGMGSQIDAITKTGLADRMTGRNTLDSTSLPMGMDVKSSGLSNMMNPDLIKKVILGGLI